MENIAGAYLYDSSEMNKTFSLVCYHKEKSNISSMNWSVFIT